MVMANTERVAKALDLLRDGLGPACEATWRGFYGDGWLQQVNSRLHSPDHPPSTGDSAFLFKGGVKMKQSLLQRRPGHRIGVVKDDGPRIAESRSRLGRLESGGGDRAGTAAGPEYVGEVRTPAPAGAENHQGGARPIRP